MNQREIPASITLSTWPSGLFALCVFFNILSAIAWTLPILWKITLHRNRRGSICILRILTLLYGPDRSFDARVWIEYGFVRLLFVDIQTRDDIRLYVAVAKL